MGVTIAPSPCSEETLAGRRCLNQRLEEITNGQIQWHQCRTPQEYRDKRRNGDGFPKPPLLKGAETLSVASTSRPYEIPLRRIMPSTAGEVKGVMLHYHAGGLVYGGADGQDNYLADFANELSVAVVSVEYRMAPEHPFPAPADDAVDALRFALSAAGEAKLGGKVLFIAGESSGAYLAAWSVLKLRGEGVDVRAQIAGLALSFGIYDLSCTPSVNQYRGRALVGAEDLKLLTDAVFPPSRYSTQQRREPELSPLYADLKGLPAAVFVVGTADAALDDSVFMASRWSLAGNETQLKIIPEACHAFTLLPMGDAGAEGRAELKAFLKNLVK